MSTCMRVPCRKIFEILGVRAYRVSRMELCVCRSRHIAKTFELSLQNSICVLADIHLCSKRYYRGENNTTAAYIIVRKDPANTNAHILIRLLLCETYLKCTCKWYPGAGSNICMVRMPSPPPPLAPQHYMVMTFIWHLLDFVCFAYSGTRVRRAAAIVRLWRLPACIAAGLQSSNICGVFDYILILVNA